MIDNLNLEDHTENPKTKVNWFKVRKNQYMFATVVVVVILLVGILVAVLNMPKDSVANSTQNNPILDSYKSKIPDLQNKVAQNPQDASALQELAVALYATGDVEGAKANYINELAVNPNDPVLYNNLGNIYRDTGEYQKAVDSYQKSIDLDAKQTNAYLNLANLYLYTLNQVDLGIGVLNTAITNNSDNAETMNLQIANSYLTLNQKDLARDAYNKVLEINPNNVNAKNALSSL